MSDIAEAAAGVQGSRWDPLVRITHWGVAVAIILNGLLTEGGGTIHIWIGYAAVAMLVLRLLWGFVGPEEARFSAFPPSLGAAREHLGDIVSGRHRWHRSHNPLGALMVYALWGTLAVIAVTGIAMAGSPFDAQPREAARVEYQTQQGVEHEADEEGEYGEGGEDGLLKEIHEVAANLILILAALHVIGVGLESRLTGRNLAREMVTGRRGPPAA